MFNIRESESNAIVADENNVYLVFPDVNDALAKMRQLMNETGKKYRIANVIDPQWKERENNKFINGDYVWPSWLNMHFHQVSVMDSDTGRMKTQWLGGSYILSTRTNHPDNGAPLVQKNVTIEFERFHFVHVSKLDHTKIAYTKDEESGSADKQTQTTIGRYLTQYHQLDNELIKYITALHASIYAPVNVKFATGQDVVTVYTKCHDTGVASCMTKPDHYYESSQHPVSVYADGDLSLAYLADDDGNIKARALVWQDKKIHGRIYGDYERLHSALRALDYSDDVSFHGAKIKRIMCDNNNRLILPYLDGVQTVTEIDDEWLKIDRNGDISASQTDGLQQEAYYCLCDRCEDEIASDDDARSVYVSRYSTREWCEHCANEYASRSCVSYDLISDSVITTVDGDVCAEWEAEDANYCEYQGEHTFNDVKTVIVTMTGMEESWSVDAIEDHSFVCRIDGNRYSNNLMEIDEWTDEPRARCNEPNDQPMLICTTPYQSGFAIAC